MSALDAEQAIADPLWTAADSITGTRRRRAPTLFWLAPLWLLVVVVLAALADVLPFVQDPYEIDPLFAKESPSSAHWFGTDDLGRDIFSRCVHGAQASLVISFSALAIGLVIGGLLGLVAGYYRGVFAAVIMTATDIVLAFPGLVLLLAILTFVGQSTRNVALALGLFAIPGFVRITRANTLLYSERLFVLAARTMGARDGRIVFREILPNLAPPLAGISLIVLGILIIAEGGLSFLGLGVPLPQPTWGGMIAAGLPDLEIAPWITLAPCLTVLSFNLCGERLRRHFELRESRA
jgi:peptide/nickel transport system permease protein